MGGVGVRLVGAGEERTWGGDACVAHWHQQKDRNLDNGTARETKVIARARARMAARVIPTILRRGSQRGFTPVKQGTCIVGMTLAVILGVG
jgi:hypothetical protein